MPTMQPMRILRYLLTAVVLLVAALPARAMDADPYRYWRSNNRAAQRDYEAALMQAPDPQRLAAWHEQLTREPHPAGSEADQRMIEMLAQTFDAMGLRTEVHEIQPYLPVQGAAAVNIIHEGTVTRLPIIEDAFVSDPSTLHRNLTAGWSAYSASGEVTAPVVYANYGTQDDFAKLDELGVDCTDCIALIRFGRIFRGDKVRNAEEAGAAGVILFTDPADSGWARGLPYPEGGWANGSTIQRGSVLSGEQPGDPLTPGICATKEAERLDPAKAKLPRIPVQPIGWDAAHAIIGLMDGDVVPRPWQGGLPLSYRVRGGEALRVHLVVDQPKALTPTANVLGMLDGDTFPNEWIIVGCHFDAWTFGAGDPHAGSIVLLEAAQSFADLARQGMRPKRTIIFAHWGAEEMGIIGSTEFCERLTPQQRDNIVAYINLDMAAMGTRFGASAAPTLKQLIMECATAVPQVGGATEQSVFDAWRGEAEEPTVQHLGGGSDHVGFAQHLCIPSASFGAYGSDGVSYHSAYDTLTWYRQVVGDDYEPARMLTQFTNVLLARLSNADLLPIDVPRYAADAVTHLDAVEQEAAQRDMPVAYDALRTELRLMGADARRVMAHLHEAIEAGTISDGALTSINALLRTMEQSWSVARGLPERPWYRNLYLAESPDNGYGSWMLPGLRWAVQQQSMPIATEAQGPYLDAVRRLREKIRVMSNIQQRMDDLLGP
jgi:N-acetylated-alpha-linked acidic dipeptidase